MATRLQWLGKSGKIWPFSPCGYLFYTGVCDIQRAADDSPMARSWLVMKISFHGSALHHNHEKGIRKTWVGWDLRRSLVQPLAQSVRVLKLDQGAQGHVQSRLNISKDGDTTASLGL